MTRSFGESTQSDGIVRIGNWLSRLHTYLMKKPNPNRVTELGVTSFRNEHKPFGIKRLDRRHHMYIIGKTGSGKSTLLENMIQQDCWQDEGLAVFDPHGDFVEHLRERIPDKRRDDVIYLNVPDPYCMFGFNPLDSVAPEKRSLAASGMLEAFKKIWDKTWGPRLEHILRNTLLTLLDQPRANLGDIRRIFFDEQFRRMAIANSKNQEVRDFWLKEYASWSPRYRSESIAPILNKIGAFLADPTLYRLLTQPKHSIDFRKVMDEGKILLVNLAKGRIGSDASTLLGALLVSKIGIAALSRAEIPEAQRRDFYLYLDEFQNFTTLSMAGMLSELRKYRLNIIAAHQYLGQIEPEVREAILGNVGTIVAFRIGLIDAKILEKEFHPEFNEYDLINLPNFNVYIKLMIDGKGGKPFSAETLPEPE